MGIHAEKLQQGWIHEYVVVKANTTATLTQKLNDYAKERWVVHSHSQDNYTMVCVLRRDLYVGADKEQPTVL